MLLNIKNKPLQILPLNTSLNVHKSACTEFLIFNTADILKHEKYKLLIYFSSKSVEVSCERLYHDLLIDVEGFISLFSFSKR